MGPDVKQPVAATVPFDYIHMCQHLLLKVRCGKCNTVYLDVLTGKKNQKSVCTQCGYEGYLTTVKQ